MDAYADGISLHIIEIWES